jgi:hypothetical protein
MRGELISIDVIKHELAKRLDSLVLQLYPLARLDSSKHNFCLGSLSGEAGQSLRIARTSTKLGWWKDFSSGEGGDVLSLVNRALQHRDMTETIKWSRQWLGLDGGMSAEERRQREREADQASRKAAQAERDEREGRRRAAQRYFLEAVPIAGTPAERYLLARDILFSRLGKWPGALRFHPGMRCPVTHAPRPCLLAKVDGPDGNLMTVHRTFLLCHDDGRVTKADQKNGGPLPDAKVAFGPYAGGLISVWKGRTGKSLRHLEAGEWVAMTEGVEDALTIAMVQPQMRAVAAISLSNLKNVTFPDRLAGLYLCADNDVKPEPQEAFRRAKAQIMSRGIAVREVRPPPQFKDFNDWARALRAQERRVMQQVQA